VDVAGGPDGAIVRIKPSGHTGALPLRSVQTQSVVGLVIRPRFEWAGVGRVLHETGWAAAPEFLDLPLAPGSGREIPPWVLAGPVMARLAELLRTAKRGYRDKAENLKRPRGRILWAEYTSEQMPAEKSDTRPCRYSDLSTDPKLRRSVRWGLERVRTDLVSVGGRVPLAMLPRPRGNAPARFDPRAAPLPGPERTRFEPRQEGLSPRRGYRARPTSPGLAGWWTSVASAAAALDGLAWTLKLDHLWELYVAAHVSALPVIPAASSTLATTARPSSRFSAPTDRACGLSPHLTPDPVLRRYNRASRLQRQVQGASRPR
jgi:hypothetical protein